MKNVLTSLMAATAISLFSGNLLFAADGAYPSTFSYKVPKNSNFSVVAKAFGIDKKEIIEANLNNPCVKSADLVLAGCYIKIPYIYLETNVLNAVEVAVNKVETEKNILISRQNARNSNSMALMATLMLSSLVLLVLMLKYIFKYQDERDLHEEAKTHLAKAKEDLKDIRQLNAEKAIKISEMEDNLRISEIKLLVRKEQLNASMSVIKQLEAKLIPGDKVKVQPRSGNSVELTVNKVRLDPKTKEREIYVECPVEDCVVNAAQSLKFKNALGHMAGHSNLLPEVCEAEPKEDNPPTTIGVGQMEGFPTKVADEPK